MSLPELKFEYPDLGKAMMTVATYRNAMTQNALAQNALQDKMDTRNAMSALYSGGTMPGQVDYQNTTNELLRRGAVDQAAKVAQISNVFNKSDPEARLKNIETAQKVLDYGLKGLPGTTLQTYPQYRTDLLNMMGAKSHPLLPDPSVFSSHQDPEGDFGQWKGWAQQQAMSIKDQIELNTPKPGPTLYGEGGTVQSSVMMPGRGVEGIQAVGGAAPKFNPESNEANMQSVVQDPDSPTGWSKVDMRGNKLTGAAPPLSVSRTAQPLTKEDEALAQMIAGGEMAPAQMAKRTGNYNAVLARAKEINPQLDIRMADMDYSTGKTASFRKQDIAIEALPQVLTNMVEAGKKLNYSNVKFIGAVEQWKNKQLNDPDFVKYMAFRNDALLSIASVMRGTGATDQAHRVEMEASSPTLPPAALEAWLEAQQESLAPRIEQYRKIYGRSGKAGNSGAPKSNYVETYYNPTTKQRIGKRSDGKYEVIQ